MKIELIGNIVEIDGERLLTVHHEVTEAGRMRLEDFIKEVDGVEVGNLADQIAELEEEVARLQAALNE